MDTDYKFIQVTTATGKLCVLNIDHIVGFKNTSRGCVVITSNPKFYITLKTTFEELIAMLPSLMKIEDINQ